MPLETPSDRLLALLAGWRRVAVAFSGGVDSAVVAKAACLALGSDAVAVTAVSPSLASSELKIAGDVAALIGIRHEVIPTEEFERPGYVANAPSRCYFCKTELYEQIARHRERLGFDVIANGANLDDRGDHRPGMKAAAEHAVRSPLIEAGLTKADVRELAKQWELPVWDKPASPCLASRVAYGVTVTPERVARIESAEQFLRDELDVRELRVRLEANDLARIEVPLTALPCLAEQGLRDQIVSRFRELGFRYVTLDLEGFRSGSLNAVVPVEALVTLK
ncbi:MAG: ATP-dependent sacrificial sulfur transferase LarE [Planctomycetaceae bacterium]